MLKANFKTLNFVSIKSDRVRAAWYGDTAEGKKELKKVQKIYRDHGWPDSTRYCKYDCLAAIEAMLEDRKKGTESN